MKEEPPVKSEVLDTLYGKDDATYVEYNQLENLEEENCDVLYGRSLRPDYKGVTQAQFQQKPYRSRRGRQSRGAVNAYNKRSMFCREEELHKIVIGRAIH